MCVCVGTHTRTHARTHARTHTHTHTKKRKKKENGNKDLFCISVCFKGTSLDRLGYTQESRRDQEEGGELDSQEKASPEQIKNSEVVLGYIYI